MVITFFGRLRAFVSVVHTTFPASVARLRFCLLPNGIPVFAGLAKSLRAGGVN